MNELLGGYCSGVPPLPIPNREVKPTCADGTAMQCGRVGSRRLYLKRESPELAITQGFFIFLTFNSYIFAFLHFYIAQAATQLVAPSAVTIAVAIDAIICTINFNVSFLLIIFNV